VISRVLQSYVIEAENQEKQKDNNPNADDNIIDK